MLHESVCMCLYVCVNVLMCACFVFHLMRIVQHMHVYIVCPVPCVGQNLMLGIHGMRHASCKTCLSRIDGQNVFAITICNRTIDRVGVSFSCVRSSHSEWLWYVPQPRSRTRHCSRHTFKESKNISFSYGVQYYGTNSIILVHYRTVAPLYSVSKCTSACCACALHLFKC